MKRWWMAALGMMMIGAAAYAAAEPGSQTVKDANGDTIGVLVICNDCKSGGGKLCHGGAEEGWLDGKPCGKCLLQANFGPALKYGSDLHVTGTLLDPSGKPIKDRFVKLFLPNGWGSRTKTWEKGTFRIMLGATAARTAKEPVVVDIGTRVDTTTKNDQYFAMFLLPQDYKPCPDDTVIPKPEAAPAAKPATTTKPGNGTKPAKKK